MKISRLLLGLITTLTLTGCGGGGGSSSDVPTSTSTVFDISRYSSANITKGTVISFYATGTWTQSDQTLPMSISQITTNDGAVTYLSETVYKRTTNITITVNGTPIVASGYVYTDLNGYIQYMSSGDTLISQTITPNTAKIGDSGPISVITNSDNDTVTTNWALKDGYNGYGLLQVYTVVKDVFGATIATETDTLKINTEGTVLSVQISGSGIETGISYKFEASN